MQLKSNCVIESSQQRPCLYKAEWTSFPGLKEEQRDRITMVTAVTCSLAGRQSEPPLPTANLLFTVEAIFKLHRPDTFSSAWFT
ncbi:hypothetical protein CRENBAI_010570 [Crenichthys baileyi]|uniref:Uncharacterized protein n=1 Tax=Crenichthys baileyi TaxID=28760 RepID=A0AAV9SBR6_9TELE